MKVTEEQPRVNVMEGPWSSLEAIQDVVATGQQEDPFYVMDLGEVVQRYNSWIELMPRVKPFYGKHGLMLFPCSHGANVI